MNQEQLVDLLKSEISVSELSSKSKGSFHPTIVPLLYQWWRENRLIVSRSWGTDTEQRDKVVYSNTGCLLPEDQLRLKETLAADFLKIATWNVNSIRIRLPLLLSWLSEQQPDIVCLQETKVEDHQFPEQELREAGYQSVFLGQKSYNGVAILSKYPMDQIQYGFANGFDPDNKRLIAARIEGITIINVYVPQGQTVESPKFQYKLEFLDHLINQLTDQFNPSDHLMVLGDINIAPEERDVVSPEAMRDMVSFHPKEHAMIERFKQSGLIDIYRQYHDEGGLYSWWDFRTRGFEKNEGMRIDHIWATKTVSKNCHSCEIDVNNRSQSKPSDHAPVICTVKPPVTQ